MQVRSRHFSRCLFVSCQCGCHIMCWHKKESKRSVLDFPSFFFFSPIPQYPKTTGPLTHISLMDETDERTSLVRSNGPSSGVASYNNNSGSGFNAGNWRPHLNGNSRPRTPATAGQDGPGRRDPRTLLTQVQRSLGFFQEWAVNLIHGQEDSAVVSWVQNARVARTFMMIINVLLAVSLLSCLFFFLSSQLDRPTHDSIFFDFFLFLFSYRRSQLSC